MPGKGRQFQPGQSGNPAGRKRGVERLFQDAIAELAFDDAVGFAALMKRLQSIIFCGEDKDSVAAIKLLLERAYGQPKQKVEITGDGEPAPFDWSKVPIEIRRQLLAIAEVDAGTSTEH